MSDLASCQNQTAVSPYCLYQIQHVIAHFKADNTRISFQLLKDALIAFTVQKSNYPVYSWRVDSVYSER